MYQDKILLIRESSKYEDGNRVGKYDIVGGRVKAGERFDQSLLREIKEETGLEAVIGKAFFVDEWRPIIKGEQWQIVATYFECFAKSDQVVLGQDHDKFVWIDPKDYKNYDIIDNYPPAFEYYIKSHLSPEHF